MLTAGNNISLLFYLQLCATGRLLVRLIMDLEAYLLTEFYQKLCDQKIVIGSIEATLEFYRNCHALFAYYGQSKKSRSIA
jgi:hypothetical protein